MISGKSVLGLIPARGGSKRVPGKNRRLFRGIPLLQLAFNEARKSKYLDLVIVSTDSQEIATLCRLFHIPILMRPADLATDSATSQSVALHALSEYPADLLCLLQPTSPFRTAADIDYCIEQAPCISYLMDRKNGAVYVTAQDCNFEGPHQRYFMPESRSLDIDTEADFQ